MTTDHTEPAALLYGGHHWSLGSFITINIRV